MRSEGRWRQILLFLSHYVVFFLVVAFAVTCCMLLFVSTMVDTLAIELTEENLNKAAKLTFGNVILISLIFTIVDTVRRHFTVYRPIKKIVDAATRIAEGDFSVRIAPLRGYDGEYSFNQVIDCFNHMAEELSGTETLRTDFVANVSHELKTPLSVMQNYATMLGAPGLSEEKREEYAKAIGQASRRLASLITNILKLNKLERQQIVPKTEPYDLGEQLCECLLGFEDVWEKKGIVIETDIAQDVTVQADAEMMSLVWNNLFSNALKFTEAGGTVSVRLYAEGESAVVQVRDTGCGISREVGARMFDKFYQGDTSHATQGNGLGLALVKRVVDLTKSEISVESEWGQGSTFTVTMRRKTDDRS